MFDQAYIRRYSNLNESIQMYVQCMNLLNNLVSHCKFYGISIIIAYLYYKMLMYFIKIFCESTVNYIKLKSRPSVRPPAVFWSNGSPPWMQGSASKVIQMKRPSSGNTKCVFKRS